MKNNIRLGIWKDNPLEWDILERQYDKTLIISKYAIACKKYNDKCTDITWCACTLRKWLNTDFLDTSFTKYEETNILATDLENKNNYAYKSKGGYWSLDKIFLLSIAEIKKYFKTWTSRQCQRYYDDKSIDNCQWWLRSPGIDNCHAAIIRQDGCLNDHGHNVYDSNVYVRPAMWINSRIELK